MPRRPTAPIPEHLLEPFYAAAWSIAADGRFVAPSGECFTVRAIGHSRYMGRRHALAVLWMTACALRFSELRRIRMADVSAAGFSAFITRSKNGLSGHVDVARGLVALTLQWRSESSIEFHSEWLLPSQVGTQLDVNAFNRDACGMFRELFAIPLTSHCFRDTACQMAMAQSGSVRVVQRLMGHRSARTTEHYLSKRSAEAFQLRLFESEYESEHRAATPQAASA